MQTIRAILTLVFLVIMVWFLVEIYTGYRQSTKPTVWERLLDAARGSATILWSKFTIALAAIIANADQICDYLGQPQAKDFINQYVGNPKLVGGIIMAVMVVNIAARNRTLTPPDVPLAG